MTDLTFQDPKGLVNRAAFNERFSVLNELYRYWWKRRSIAAHWDIVLGSLQNSVVFISVQMDPSRVQTFQYSDHLNLSDTGEFSLKDPVTIKYSFDTWESAKNTLSGKYVQITTLNTATSDYGPDVIWYIPSNANFVATGYYQMKVDIQSVGSQYITDLGSYDYVYSDDRDAYPDSGQLNGVEYQYLGIPFENAREVPKIATGSYTGTGTYGSSNPNTLTFEFEPKLVIVGDLCPAKFASGEWSRSFLWTFGQTLTYITSNGYSDITFEQNGSQLEWYVSNNTMNAENQLNARGTEYRYLAIG